MRLADGRYLARDGESGESVLVIKTIGAPAPPRRRRRRPRDADADPSPLPLSRATAIRAATPFASENEARRWLDEATEAEETADLLVAEGIALLNRALHAAAVAAGDPHGQTVTAERSIAARLGIGDGEQVADGRYAEAREIDVWAGGASRRRRREEDLRPQERVAAVLGGRENLDACETLLLRARADLDAGRDREAALQLRVGLEALLVELRDALDDTDHRQDVATLTERRHEAGDAANAALEGELDATTLQNVTELLQLCERILRRRRVLRG